MSYRKVKMGNAKRQTGNARRQTGTANKVNNTNGGGAKKVLLILALVLVIALAASRVIGAIIGPTKEECREVIEQFQTACNELDVDGMLDCLQPSVSNPLKIALGIGSAVTSQSSDEMLESVLNALDGSLSSLTEATGLSASGLFETMEIEPTRYGLPGKTRKVKCKVEIGGLTKTAYFYVVKKDGEAYLSKFSLSD